MDQVNKQHLIQRRQTWYVQLRVPKHLVPVVGRHLLCRSLKTRDIGEASKLKHAVLAEWHRRLLLADRHVQQSCSQPPDRLLAFGRLLLDEVHAGEVDPDEALEEFTDVSDDLYTNWVEQNPDKWIGDLASETQNQTLRGMRAAIADGKRYTLLSEAIDTYLEGDKNRLRVATLKRRRTYLSRFKDWHTDCGLNDVTKADAGRYVTEVLEPSRLAPATIKQGIGDLSGFFQWCSIRGLCESNPFEGVARTVRTVKRGVRASGDELRPWTDDELVTLLTQTPHDSCLWIMSVLALYTGMRQNELAEAKCQDVMRDEYGTWIAIPEAKTKAGKRNVPVHPVIAPLIQHLSNTSQDGYIVPGLKPEGYDGKRGHMVSKRFGYHKKVKLGLPTALKFHGLRKNFATQIYRADVPVDRLEQIIGHSHGNLAQDVYIDGSGLEQLVKDVQSLSHGETIDGCVAHILTGCPATPDRPADVKLTVIR